MKTTLEIPTTLFRKAKSAATERGIPFRELVSEALAEKLQVHDADKKPWMKLFGKLHDLHEETVRLNLAIEEEFEGLEPEDRE